MNGSLQLLVPFCHHTEKPDLFLQVDNHNDGRTLYEALQILGHSDPKVTMRYGRLSTKALREAANNAAVKIRE